MYKLYSCQSPNVFKVALFLEEAQLEWEPVSLDVSGGEQFSPEFRALSPAAKVPLLIDSAPADGTDQWVVWESGAILLYLAEKHGRFLPHAPRARGVAVQWLFWQMAALGPMLGQHAHFLQYHKLIPDNEYAKQRYAKEARSVLRVLNNRLQDHEFIAGEYSIADMACFPWVNLHEMLRLPIADLTGISRWINTILNRQATQNAYARIRSLPTLDRGIEERFRIMCTDRPEL